MDVITEVLSQILDLFTEMASAFMKTIPRFVMLILWILSAFFILPCVFVASNLYPAWVEWGEEM